jgi:hypothetical protein
MNDTSTPQHFRSPNFTELCKTLNELNLDLHPHPTELRVLVPVRMSSLNPILVYALKDGLPVLKLIVLIPVIVPTERRSVVGEFLHALNYRLDLGSFRMDPADGELQFIITHDFTGSPEFPANTLKRMTLIAHATVDGFFPALAKVIYAGMKVDQALEQGEAHYVHLRGLDPELPNPNSSSEAAD